MIIQFLAALNDIVIRRYNNQREILDKFRVTMLYSPKQRVVFDLINKSKQLILPVIAVSIGGITRDPERVFNKLEGSYYDNEGYGDDTTERLRQPLPIDLTLNVSILSRYEADVDQIIDNFVPYFDPYIVISWRVPDFKHIINSTVHWSGSINMSYPTDLTPTQPYHVTADTSFTIKGWLFKSLKVGAQKIYTIESSYTAVKDLRLKYNDLLIANENNDQTDAFTITARPKVRFIHPPMAVIANIEETSVFEVYGDMFEGTTGVYLSGANNIFSIANSAINLFSTNAELSSVYSAFSGVPATDFEVLGQNKLVFTIPTPVNIGTVDIIVVNEGGYGKLRTDSILPTTNPYLSAMPEFASYIEPQNSSVNGLTIV